MHDVVRQFGGGNMFPAFYIFGKQIGMYGVCAVLGFLVSGFVGSKLARRRGISTEDLILVTLSAAIGLFIGGHILFGLTNFDKLIKLFGMIGSISFGSFLYCLGVIFGGSVFYGGLLGGIAAVSVYCRVSHSVDRTDMLDVMAVCVPLFHTFGRIGCFLGGCCYGLPCSFGFTVNENPFNPAICGVSRFPVQLVEAGFNLIIFFVLLSLSRRLRLRGQIMYVYFLIYPVVRFSLEFLRGDEIRGIWFGLSTSQWISIALFVFALIRVLMSIGRTPEHVNDGDAEKVQCN